MPLVGYKVGYSVTEGDLEYVRIMRRPTFEFETDLYIVQPLNLGGLDWRKMVIQGHCCRDGQ